MSGEVENFPSASLVPFWANPLPGAEVVFADKGLRNYSDQELLNRFAYSAGEDTWRAGGLPHSKRFLAERYGGYGIGSNGGGARCGLDGDYQIKGIGINPLVGSRGDPWHTDGSCALSDCLREAAWGRILSQVLPGGAVEVECIIATGHASPYKMLDRSVQAAGGLAIRRAAARPGHFMRSTFFKPRREADGLLVADRERVRSAIQFIERYLPEPEISHGGSAIAAGINEFCRRSAEQLAVANAHRIVHGGLSPSNMTLNGRWIDFGSVTTFPTYKASEDYHGGFWAEPNQVIKVISELFFHLRKYRRDVVGLLDEGLAVDIFNHQYEKTLNRSFVEHCGVPSEVFNRMSEKDRSRSSDLGRMLVAVAKRDATSSRERNSTSILCTALRALSSAAVLEEDEAQLTDVLFDYRLASKLTGEYRTFLSKAADIARGCGVDKVNLVKIMQLNSEKLAMELDFPGRADFESLLAIHISEGSDGCRAAIKKVLEAADDVAVVEFIKRPDFKVILSRGADTETLYDARYGCEISQPVDRK